MIYQTGHAMTLSITLLNTLRCSAISSKGLSAIPRRMGRFSCGFIAATACAIDDAYSMYKSLWGPDDSPNKNCEVVGTEEGFVARWGAMSTVVRIYSKASNEHVCVCVCVPWGGCSLYQTANSAKLSHHNKDLVSESSNKDFSMNTINITSGLFVCQGKLDLFVC